MGRGCEGLLHQTSINIGSEGWFFLRNLKWNLALCSLRGRLTPSSKDLMEDCLVPLPKSMLCIEAGAWQLLAGSMQKGTFNTTIQKVQVSSPAADSPT